MTPSPVTDTKVCFVGIAQSLMPSPVTDTKVCFVGIAQSLNSRDSMDCSPPGSSVHAVSQARKLEWIAISFSRGSSQPRVW